MAFGPSAVPVAPRVVYAPIEGWVVLTALARPAGMAELTLTISGCRVGVSTPRGVTRATVAVCPSTVGMATRLVGRAWIGSRPFPGIERTVRVEAVDTGSLTLPVAPTVATFAGEAVRTLASFRVPVPRIMPGEVCLVAFGGGFDSCRSDGLNRRWRRRPSARDFVGRWEVEGFVEDRRFVIPDGTEVLPDLGLEFSQRWEGSRWDVWASLGEG